MVIQFILMFIWMGIVPALAGVCFLRKKDTISIVQALICGYAYMFALAEVLCLLMMCLKTSLSLLAIVFGAAMAVTAITGTVKLIVSLKNRSQRIKHEAKDYLFLIAAVVVVALISVYVSLNTHYDADDAFYVAMAVTERYTDSIYRVNPYTGLEYRVIPIRYVLSQYPTLLAVFSVLCGGINPAVLAHMGYPLILIPLAFIVGYAVSGYLFPDEPRAQGLFVLLCAALVWFSGYSIYSDGMFLLGRLWQGKGTVAGIWLPMLLYLGIKTLTEKDSEIPAYVLFFAVIGICMLSTMGFILGPLTVGCLTLYGIFSKKSARVLLTGLLCITPAIALAAAYLIILKTYF